jgi:hypothetical protein
MIYLYASSSNSLVFSPSQSFANGDSFIIRFTDAFSKEQFFAQGTGSNFSNWIKFSVDLTGSYTINENKSQLPLFGATYDVSVYDAEEFGLQWDTDGDEWEIEASAWNDAFAAYSVYGSESRVWSLMGNTWSQIPAIPSVDGSSIYDTRAFVSQSVLLSTYASSNENATYYVYNG